VNVPDNTRMMCAVRAVVARLGAPQNDRVEDVEVNICIIQCDAPVYAVVGVVYCRTSIRRARIDVAGGLCSGI